MINLIFDKLSTNSHARHLSNLFQNNQVFTVCLHTAKNNVFAVCLHTAKKPCVLIGQEVFHADRPSRPLDLGGSNGLNRSGKLLPLSPSYPLPLSLLLSSTRALSLPSVPAPLAQGAAPGSGARRGTRDRRRWWRWPPLSPSLLHSIEPNLFSCFRFLQGRAIDVHDDGGGDGTHSEASSVQIPRSATHHGGGDGTQHRHRADGHTGGAAGAAFSCQALGRWSGGADAAVASPNSVLSEHAFKRLGRGGGYGTARGGAWRGCPSSWPSRRLRSPVVGRGRRHRVAKLLLHHAQHQHPHDPLAIDL